MISSESAIFTAPICDSPPTNSRKGWFFNQQSKVRALRLIGYLGSSSYCNNLLWTLGTPNAACVSPAACSEVLRAWPYWYTEDGNTRFLIDCPPDCFCPSNYRFGEVSYAGHAPSCTHCLSSALPLVRARIEAIWNELPEALNLGTWNALNALAMAAVGDLDE